LNAPMYLNRYPAGVGSCIGYAYANERDADQSASPCRIGGRAHKVLPFDIPSDVVVMINSVAVRKKCAPELILIDAMRKYMAGSITKSLSPDLQRDLDKYARETHTTPETVLAESVRAYLRGEA
jgi:hypothetical protein